MSDSKKDKTRSGLPGSDQSGGSPFRSVSASSSRSNRSSSKSGSSSGSGTPPKPPSPRFGSLGSRFGSSTIEFEIRPVEDTFVRFDLSGLGDPFHRILGTDLNLDHAEPKLIAKTISEGGEAVDTLVQHLDTSWNSYALNGALMMYAWQDDIRLVIGTKATFSPKSGDVEYYDDDDNDDNKKAETPDETRKSPVCLRAIDHNLVLNILGRTRSGILLAEAPLSLEEGFIERSLISDDPRLVALARATGCLEEQIMVQ